MLFGPVLREQGNARMVYSAPIWFRVAFGIVAVAIVLSIASVPEGPFLARLNVLSISLIAICIFAALYLERWTFDKTTNLFERNVGILMLYSRRKHPLDTLEKVVLRERAGNRPDNRPSVFGVGPRSIAVLSVVDREGRVYTLDIVRSGSLQSVRRSAERLSAFCSIPLEEQQA